MPRVEEIGSFPKNIPCDAVNIGQNISKIWHNSIPFLCIPRAPVRVRTNVNKRNGAATAYPEAIIAHAPGTRVFLVLGRNGACGQVPREHDRAHSHLEARTHVACSRQRADRREARRALLFLKRTLRVRSTTTHFDGRETFLCTAPPDIMYGHNSPTSIIPGAFGGSPPRLRLSTPPLEVRRPDPASNSDGQNPKAANFPTTASMDFDMLFGDLVDVEGVASDVPEVQVMETVAEEKRLHHRDDDMDVQEDAMDPISIYVR